MLRPAGLLRGNRTAGAVAVTAVLLAGVPACDGTGVGTRAALAAEGPQGAHGQAGVDPAEAMRAANGGAR